MILPMTKLNVTDNSGALQVRCIRVIATNKKYGCIGDTVVVSILSLLHGTPTLKKGQVIKGVIVRTKKGVRRPNGIHIRFHDNAIVLLNPQGSLLGTRVLGSIPNELRRKLHLKLMSLAESII